MQSPNVLQLVILWDQITGATQVTGPINNLVVALGMLEAAKDAIIKHIDQLKKSNGIVPAASLPSNLRM